MGKGISKKLKEEIHFLCNYDSKMNPRFTPTKEEIIEYQEYTTLGKGIKNLKNRLIQAKRLFEITYKMWIEDIKVIITKEELLEDLGKFTFVRKILENV